MFEEDFDSAEQRRGRGDYSVLDLRIDGPGYFLMTDPEDGTPSLTRWGGNFHINGNGVIVGPGGTLSGFLANSAGEITDERGPLQLPIWFRSLTVNEQGKIQCVVGMMPNESDEITVGQIALVDGPDQNALIKLPSLSYLLPEWSDHINGRIKKTHELVVNGIPSRIISGDLDDPRTCFEQGRFFPNHGNHHYTGESLDLAIYGDGYFVVYDPKIGQRVYTRAGNFNLHEGLLVDAWGRCLTDGKNIVKLPRELRLDDISSGGVSSRGHVEIRLRGETVPEVWFQCSLAYLKNAEEESLIDAGEGGYVLKSESDPPVIDFPHPIRNRSLIRSGYLESIPGMPWLHGEKSFSQFALETPPEETEDSSKLRHVAINGYGFFLLMDVQKRFLLTREGEFFWDEEGWLRHVTGHWVMGYQRDVFLDPLQRSYVEKYWVGQNQQRIVHRVPSDELADLSRAPLGYLIKLYLVPLKISMKTSVCPSNVSLTGEMEGQEGSHGILALALPDGLLEMVELQRHVYHVSSALAVGRDLWEFGSVVSGVIESLEFQGLSEHYQNQLAPRDSWYAGKMQAHNPLLAASLYGDIDALVEANTPAHRQACTPWEILKITGRYERRHAMNYWLLWDLGLNYNALPRNIQERLPLEKRFDSEIFIPTAIDSDRYLTRYEELSAYLEDPSAAMRLADEAHQIGMRELQMGGEKLLTFIIEKWLCKFEKAYPYGCKGPQHEAYFKVAVELFFIAQAIHYPRIEAMKQFLWIKLAHDYELLGQFEKTYELLKRAHRISGNIDQQGLLCEMINASIQIGRQEGVYFAKQRLAEITQCANRSQQSPSSDFNTLLWIHQKGIDESADSQWKGERMDSKIGRKCVYT